MSSDHPLPLAPRDLLILAVLAEGPAHGYGIIKAVESRSASGVFLDPANLYRVLRRMRGLGWIRETREGCLRPAMGDAPETPRSEGGAGPPRRTYAITASGSSLLASELARLERLLMQAKPALAAGEGS